MLTGSKNKIMQGIEMLERVRLDLVDGYPFPYQTSPELGEDGSEIAIVVSFIL